MLKNLIEAKSMKWKIDCNGTTHTIALNRGVNIRDPMTLVQDGQVIARLSIPSTSPIAKMEYRFQCDGEELLLVVFTNKADLVFQNTWQSTKRKYYAPNRAFSLIGILIAVILNIAAPLLLGNTTLSWTMAACYSILAISTCLNPFHTPGRKILRLMLWVLLNWLISFMFLLLIGGYQ